MTNVFVHQTTKPSARRFWRARGMVEALLGTAGIALDGGAPWDIRVHDDRLFTRFLTQGTLGFGEAYMDGWWDCERLDEMTTRALRNNADDFLFDWRDSLLVAWTRLRNRQTIARAGQVALQHYDLGNAFFARMLGPTMNYSCAYWPTARNLDEAQTAKMELVARKLQLRPGDRVLDVGCGWGSMALHAAERHGCHVVGVTVSEQQCTWATERLRGTSAQVHVLDYRSEELKRMGPFDKILSIGMFEHVGRHNYEQFFSTIGSLLRDNGLFLLHSIFNEHCAVDPWMNKYIFPNGMMPSLRDVMECVRRRFVVEDVHNIGANYDRTVMEWHANVERHKVTDDQRSDRFRRMWRYYLLTAAGSFRARNRNQVHQLVLSKRGVPGGYESVR